MNREWTNVEENLKAENYFLKIHFVKKNGLTIKTFFQ